MKLKEEDQYKVKFNPSTKKYEVYEPMLGGGFRRLCEADKKQSAIFIRNVIHRFLESHILSPTNI
jgi:hypothetical protein